MSRRNSRRRQQAMNAKRRARSWLKRANAWGRAYWALRNRLRNGPPIRIEPVPLVEFGLEPRSNVRWMSRAEIEGAFVGSSPTDNTPL